MLCGIVLLTLLISSACAAHLEMHKEPFPEFDFEGSGEIPKEQLPGLCWACKWTMGKLRQHISNTATKDDIKNQLAIVCDGIGFLKSLCRWFVNKYMDVLTEELSTDDRTKTICVNIGVC
nr:antimicrobial peptide NK-lysin-like [Danio rerio]|eukprot:XP_021328759.1 antimicrobial peptide NK-lysin-like [Danio rerio]